MKVFNIFIVLGFVSLAACGAETTTQPEQNAAAQESEAPPAPNDAPLPEGPSPPAVTEANAEPNAAGEDTMAQAENVAPAPDAFRICAVCHAVEQHAAAKIGPNLFGVLNRPAGAVAGFSYSDAMRNSGLVWDAESLDSFLENPQEFVPGTQMAFAGEHDAGRRDEIINYLSALGAE